MKNTELDFFLQLSKLSTVISRKLDGSLGGLGWSEFILLYHLDQSPDKKRRRIDLAERAGLTASGVTRLLLPMEKVGLVSKESNSEDARVSLVALAPGGKEKLDEAMERMGYIAQDLLGRYDAKKVEEFVGMLQSVGGAMMWR